MSYFDSDDVEAACFNCGNAFEAHSMVCRGCGAAPKVDMCCASHFGYLCPAASENFTPREAFFVPATFVEVEYAHLRAMLNHFRWNISETARALDSDRRTVYRKMKRYGISKPSSNPDESKGPTE